MWQINCSTVCLFGDCFLKDLFCNDKHFRVAFYTCPSLAHLFIWNSEFDLHTVNVQGNYFNMKGCVH